MKITDALRVEHTIFLAVFEEIERMLPSLSTPNEIRTVASIIESLLRGHAARETNLAYLAMDHVLANDDSLKRMHQDHHEIDERLHRVHNAGTCAEARKLLQTVIIGAREHFRLEEKLVFPLLEKTLKQETLLDLGSLWSDRSDVLKVASSAVGNGR